MATDERADPFAQLLRSHRRLEERLRDLPLAAADLDGEKHSEARAYIEETLAWMERAVRRHEDDEEQSLFPRLLNQPSVAPIIAKLSDEHRLHERLQRELKQAVTSDAARTRELVTQLQAAYATHINEEEQQLFPAAQKLLSASDLTAIANEMESRRGR